MLLRVSGADFLAKPAELQAEAFGNATLFVVAANIAELGDIVRAFEGNLTASVYSDRGGADDDIYAAVEPDLRVRVGRLINDKMPTGVAVSPAMNHGGPFPANGHPGFTAVGIPASLRRFSLLECYDNVRQERLPGALRDKHPGGNLWRQVDGAWSQADVG